MDFNALRVLIGTQQTTELHNALNILDLKFKESETNFFQHTCNISQVRKN